jgi:nitrogen-specific signal transduction histidine kinase
MTHARSRALCAAARDVLHQRVAISPRRQLAGGSGATDETRSFAREVGRELGRPLTTLWNRIEVMLAEMQGAQPPADLLSDLETLRRHAAQMVAIVKGLICLGGERVFELRPVNVNAVVEQTLSPIVPRLAGRQIDIRWALDQTVPQALGDGDALGYALTVLVETAAAPKARLDITTNGAADGGGQVTIGTRRESQAVPGVNPDALVRLELVDAIVRSLGGRLERRVGNPVATVVLSLRGAA